MLFSDINWTSPTLPHVFAFCLIKQPTQCPTCLSEARHCQSPAVTCSHLEEKCWKSFSSVDLFHNEAHVTPEEQLLSGEAVSKACSLTHLPLPLVHLVALCAPLGYFRVSPSPGVPTGVQASFELSAAWGLPPRSGTWPLEVPGAVAPGLGCQEGSLRKAAKGHTTG